eukprot:scaffold4260_cov178-Ochromonas_danica.AAC.1
MICCGESLQQTVFFPVSSHDELAGRPIQSLVSPSTESRGGGADDFPSHSDAQYVYPSIPWLLVSQSTTAEEGHSDLVQQGCREVNTNDVASSHLFCLLSRHGFFFAGQQ